MNPWNNYEEFFPHKMESTKFDEEAKPESARESESKPRKRISLNEPEKANQ